MSAFTRFRSLCIEHSLGALSTFCFFEGGPSSTTSAVAGSLVNVLRRFSIWLLRSASEIFATDSGISVGIPYLFASGNVTVQGAQSIDSRVNESRNSLLIAILENSFLSLLQADPRKE
jgi:hypothetical protein